MKWWLVGAAALVLVGAIAFWPERAQKRSSADANAVATVDASQRPLSPSENGTARPRAATPTPPTTPATPTAPATTPRLPPRMASGTDERVAHPGESGPVGFATQDRDDQWASAREGRLRAAVASIRVEGASIGTLECRRTSCRIPVTGTTKAVVDLVERLSEERSFIAGSESLSLSRDRGASGEMSAMVFLHYIR